MPPPADRLLSFVAGECREKDSDWPRLRGILHHTWLSNQAQIAVALRVAQILEGACAKPVWLDDLALALTAYSSLGQRSINELCAWVHQDRLAAGSSALEVEGYQTLHRDRWESVHRSGKLVLRLVGAPLPNRSSVSAAGGRVRGLTLAEPRTMLFRLCLRPAALRDSLWLVDVSALAGRLDCATVKREASARAVSLAVGRALREISRVGLEWPKGDWRRFGLSWKNVTPGEWCELLLGPRRLTRFLLDRVPGWSHLPLGMVKFILWRLKEDGRAHTLPG
jgi:hypothetical protein